MDDTTIPLVQAPGEDSDGEDFGSRNYRPYNRGNKLKRLLEQPHSLPSRPTLWPLHHLDEEYEYISVGNRRAIVRKRQRSLVGTDNGSLDDPYSEIKMEEIWTLPDKPDDLRSIEPVVHTLKSRDLHILSGEAMKMVEGEVQLYRTLTQFTELLQGENPSFEDVQLDDVPAELVAGLQEDAEELVGCISEVMNRLQETRKHIIRATMQKHSLSERLNIGHPNAAGSGVVVVGANYETGTSSSDAE
ncbi:hypothetical protein HK105_205944 [Polyrhizophydium stewartii]|uniref:Transcriptional regulatory protein RXT2 N-terminal domain-containing protein n=1 Tax=Polyrhizophydium stewartii TaxID=2732419 RepID=A0ABR4N525_9FUNG|nr:hypothetical protein HK105_004024 [Polyrhizophydium stewartii]